MTVRVWTDGSCVQGQWKGTDRIPRRETSGAWAAVIDTATGEVVEVTGRAIGTTNTAMEMRAAIEGLQAVPTQHGGDVVLYSDCSTVRHVHWLWAHKELPSRKKLKGLGREEWLVLAVEIERLGARVEQIGKDSPDWKKRQFLRAHRAAGREAKLAFREPEKEKPKLPLSATRADRKGSAWVHEKDLPR